MELLCNRIVDRMAVYDIVSPEDKPFYSYELQVILESIIAHAVILVIALVCGYFIEVLLFTLAFSVLRIHTGGFHCKTNFGCIIMSVMTCLLVVFVCITIVPYNWIITVLTVAAMVVIYIFGTVNNKNLDLSPEEYTATVKASRKWLLTAFVVLVLLRLLSDTSYYISFLEMGFVICASSMILAKTTEKGGPCYEEDRT